MFSYGVQGRMRGISNCSGLGALSLSLNKAVYSVGESPAYSVLGAAPASEVHWSSTKDGLPTSETDAFYGQVTDGLGVWAGAGGAWTPTQAGQWVKTVQVGSETDSKAFQVLPITGTNNTPGVTYVGVPTTQQNASSVPGFFDGEIDILGVKIPKVAAYGGAALLAWMILKKK